MSEPFHGVLPALITPFTDDGAAIDADALAAIVDRLVGAGVAGLVPAGAPASSRRCQVGSAAGSSRSRSRRPPAAFPWSPAPARSPRARPSS